MIVERISRSICLKIPFIWLQRHSYLSLSAFLSPSCIIVYFLSPTIQIVSGSPTLFIQVYLGAVQKLRNVQRGEGVDDFVTYCYVYFEGEGGVFCEIVT